MPLNITAKLGMDSKGFKAGAERARQSASRMKGHMTKQFAGVAAGMAGMFAVAAIGSQVKKTIEWATRIRDLGTQFGVSTEFVQKMDYAFKQTGTDAEFAFKAMRKMMLNQSIALNELTSGMTASVKFDAFGKLGISVQQLQAMGPEKLFMAIAANMKGVNVASSDLHEALNVVFGKSGSQLLVTFGSDLAAMHERMEELGLVDDEAIQRLGAIGDKMEEFKTQNRGIWADIVAGASTAWMGLVNTVSAAIDIIAQRMVLAWSGLSKIAGAAGKLWEGIKNRDLDTIKEARKEFSKATGDIGAAVGGEKGRQAFETFTDPDSSLKEKVKGAGGILKGAMGGFAKDNLMELGEKIAAKNKAMDDRLKQKEDMQALNEQMAAVGNIDKDRKKVADQMDKLEEKALKRRFDALSPAQQLLDLERKLALEKSKLSKMPAFFSDAEIAATVAGIDKVTAAKRRAEMEFANRNREKLEQKVSEQEEELDETMPFYTEAQIAGAIEGLDEVEAKQQRVAMEQANRSRAELLKSVSEKKALLEKMPPIYTEEQIKKAEQGLTKVEAAQKRADMEQSNLDRAEQQQALIDAGEKIKEKRGEIAEGQKTEEKATPMAGEVKFGSLARIGGSLGLRNPVLDAAKKQLKVMESVDSSAGECVRYIKFISGH